MIFPKNVAWTLAVYRRESAREGKPASIDTPNELFVMVLLVTVAVMLPALCGLGVPLLIGINLMPELKFGTPLLELKSFPLTKRRSPAGSVGGTYCRCCVRFSWRTRRAS